MRQKSVSPEAPSERIVKNIRQATRKRHSSEEKIQIGLDGLRDGGRLRRIPFDGSWLSSNNADNDNYRK